MAPIYLLSLKYKISLRYLSTHENTIILKFIKHDANSACICHFVKNNKSGSISIFDQKLYCWAYSYLSVITSSVMFLSLFSYELHRNVFFLNYSSLVILSSHFHFLSSSLLDIFLHVFQADTFSSVSVIR